MSIAVLKSAVRGIHVYQYIPAKGAVVSLSNTQDIQVKAKYPRAIQVTHEGKMVGHLAAEHTNLVFRWLNNHPQYKVMYLIILL